MKILILLSFVLLSRALWGQETTPERPVYYYDVTESAVEVHAVYDKKLNIEYKDIYGRWKGLLLQLFDKNQALAGQYQLDKVFGKNHYQVKVEGLKEEEVYKGFFADESGGEHLFYFKLEPPVPRTGADIKIVSLPVNFSCAAGSPKMIDYYGEIKGGISPYEVDWFIVNQSKTNLLYQPFHSMLKEGKTSVITVDSAPPYYVILRIKDFCGGESQRIAQVVCDNSEKQIHTLFIEEPFGNIPGKSTGKLGGN